MIMSKQLMESYYRTYNSENAAELRKFYSEDVILVSGQGEQNGAQSIIDMYNYLTTVFSDKMTPQNIQVDGNTVVVDILDQFEAKTDIEDFMGMSLAKGDKFELKLTGTYEIEGGRFKRVTIEQQG